MSVGSYLKLGLLLHRRNNHQSHLIRPGGLALVACAVILLQVGI